MARKSRKPAAEKADTFPRKAIPLPLAEGDCGEAVERKFAALVMSPEMAAYRAIDASENKSGLSEQIDVPSMFEVLRDQAAMVNRGDLSQVEAMLMNQATALQSLFARLTERGMRSDFMPEFDANMRMALRAQSQCRATLEALAAIKNPPLVYAKQANVTTGPQQINNGTAPPSGARENEIEQTQLSGAPHELLPDARASQASSRIDSTLETVGEIDRAKIPRR